MIDTLKITNAVAAQIHAGDDVPVIPAFSAQDDFNPAGTVSVELQTAELMARRIGASLLPFTRAHSPPMIPTCPASPRFRARSSGA